jgi:hypothetical protein
MKNMSLLLKLLYKIWWLKLTELGGTTCTPDVMFHIVLKLEFVSPYDLYSVSDRCHVNRIKKMLIMRKLGNLTH